MLIRVLSMEQISFSELSIVYGYHVSITTSCSMITRQSLFGRVDNHQRVFLEIKKKKSSGSTV